MNKETKLGEGDFRKILPRFTPEALEKNQGLVDLLKRIAGEKKATPVVTAMDPNINTAPDSPAMLRMASQSWGAHGGRQPRVARARYPERADGLRVHLDRPLPARHAGNGPGSPRGRAHGGMDRSGYLIGFSLGQLFWGPISDRHGRRLPVAIGLVLFVVGSAGCALAGSIWALIGRRVLQAVGACAGVALVRAVIGVSGGGPYAAITAWARKKRVAYHGHCLRVWSASKRRGNGAVSLRETVFSLVDPAGIFSHRLRPGALASGAAGCTCRIAAAPRSSGFANGRRAALPRRFLP